MCTERPCLGVNESRQNYERSGNSRFYQQNLFKKELNTNPEINFKLKANI